MEAKTPNSVVALLAAVALLTAVSVGGGRRDLPAEGGPAPADEWRLTQEVYQDAYALATTAEEGPAAQEVAVAPSNSALETLRQRQEAAEALVAGREPGAAEAAPEPDVEAVEVPARPTSFQLLKHSVQRGESFWTIARQYGIDVDTLTAANEGIDPTRLQPGQEVRVPNLNGALHAVAQGDTLWDIAQLYQTDLQEIVRVNGLDDPSRLRPGTVLLIPGAQALVAQRLLLVDSNGRLRRAFDWPVRGRISSRFGPRWGRMHEGLDIAVNTGTRVRAAADGVVRFAGWNGGYGYLVVIDHGRGIETRYAHNSRLQVKRGQRVSRGEVIALSGSTGNSTGPHVHFEIRQNGKPVDPLRYLR